MQNLMSLALISKSNKKKPKKIPKTKVVHKNVYMRVSEQFQKKV